MTPPLVVKKRYGVDSKVTDFATGSTDLFLVLPGSFISNVDCGLVAGMQAIRKLPLLLHVVAKPQYYICHL